MKYYYRNIIVDPIRNKRLLFELLVFLSLFSSVFGQDNDKTFELFNNLTGSSYDYVARDYIKLKDGFTYTAQTGQSFSASIDESLILPTDYQTPIDPDTRVLNKSLNVGSISGVANVSDFGAATYAIPIYTPDGIAGKQPGISIQYSSQASSGILGVGWDIAGLSVIARVPKNIYNDTEIKAIGLDMDDPFALDGNRLIATSETYGTDGDTYRTEMEMFYDITSFGSSGNGPSWFTVESKDKTIYEYGKTENSRIQATGSSTVLLWRLNKVKDIYGNSIEYEYGEENGESWIKEIRYAGNPDQGLPYSCTIKFYYDKKNDKNTIFIGGSDIAQSVMLRSIVVENKGERVRKYDFKYSFNKYTHLNEIKEENGIGESLNSTIVEWGENASQFTGLNPTNDQNPTDEYADYIYYMGDYNGDGKTDYVRTPDKDEFTSGDYWELFINQDGVNFVRTDYGELSITNVSKGVTDLRNYLYSQAMDFNGDGLDDLVMIEYLNIVPGMYEYNEWLLRFKNPPFWDYRYKVYLSDGNSLTLDKELYEEEEIDQMYSSNINNKLPRILFGNFNGDGKTKTYHIYEDDPRYDYEFETIDFNGDGKDDLLQKNGTNISILEVNGSSTNTLFGASDILTSLSDKYLTGDFNGDGKTDMAINYSVLNKWYIRYSNGTTFEPGVEVDIDDIVVIGNKVIAKDFDGNGQTDILIITDGTTVHYDVYYFHGNLISKESLNMSQTSDYFSEKFNYGDFNGDGKLDIFYKHLFEHIYSFHKNEKVHLVSSITDGFGNKVTFNYTALTDNSVYTKGSDIDMDEDVLVEIQPPLYVVSSMEIPDGIGSIITVNYTYSDAKMHREGRGLLGFSQVVSSGPFNTVTRDFEVNNTCFVPQLKSEKIVSPTGSSISDVTYSYLTNSLGNKRYFIYPNSITNIDRVGNTTLNTTEYDDPESGNLSKIKSVINEDDSGVEKTFSDYYLGLPGTVTSTYSRDGADDITISEVFTYNSNGSLNKVVKNGVTSSFTYDNYGNIMSKTLVGSGISESRITSFTYDATKRFVTSVTNPFDHIERMTVDNLGNVLVQEDVNGYKTRFEYDDWGKLIKTTLPDNSIVTSSLNWSNPGGEAPPNAFYHTSKYVDSELQSTTYFDILGRTIRNYNISISKKVFIHIEDKEFNGLGQLVTETLTKPDGTSDITTHIYYPDLRLKKTTLPTGLEIDYSYTNGHVRKEYSTGEYFTKIYDGSGLVIQTLDRGGINRFSYNSLGKVRSINSNIVIEYDDNGFQKSLDDPDAGKTNYTYNVFGELTSQTDANGNVTDFEYDQIGRLTKENDRSSGYIKEYYYDPTGNVGALESITCSNSRTSITYSYGVLGRLEEETRDINGESFTTQYNYDSENRVDQIIYPNGFALEYTYGNEDEIVEIRNGSTSIWKLDSYDINGLIEQVSLGNGRQSVYSYDTYSRLTGLDVSGLIDYDYSYNGRDNLTGRTEKFAGQAYYSETFTYDNVNRLNEIYRNGSMVQDMEYELENNGRIVSKTGVGEYLYDGNHQVLQVDPCDYTPVPNNLTYNSIGKIETIVQGDKTLNLTYGVDDQRIKSQFTSSNGNYTRYYAGNYEKEIMADGTVRHLNYIMAPTGLVAICEQKNSVDKIYYVYTDRLGSIRCITNPDGSVKERLAYDAWGNRCNPFTGELLATAPAGMLTSRGFTGHEHLDNFSLINMNGRIYDPQLSVFLSPDNFVQMPDFSQNFNRYAYCLNNPLMYTDPSGEIIPQLIGLGISYLWQQHKGTDLSSIGNPQQDVYDLLGVFAGSIGNTFGSYISGLYSTGGFLNGFINGLAEGGASGFSEGFVTGLMGRQDFGQALRSGLEDGLYGGTVGGLIGGVAGGIDAVSDGRRFFDGAFVENQYLVDQNIPIVGQDGNYNCGPACVESVDRSFGGNITQYNMRDWLGGDSNENALGDVSTWKKYASKSGRRVFPSENKENAISEVLSTMQDDGRVAINLNTGDIGHSVVMKSITQRTISKMNGNIKIKYIYRVMNPGYGGSIKRVSENSIINSHNIFYIF